MMISNRASAAAARDRRRRFYALGALLLLLVVVALWRAPLTGLLVRALTPVMLARHGAGEDAQLASTTAALADRDALYAENLELKSRLGRDGSAARILGAVIMRPPETPYDTLLIDAGFAEGVAIDDKVSAGGTAIIGTVTELYAHASRVTLYSAPGEKYDGLLRGSVPLAVEGQGGGSLRAQVPSGTEVAVGDSVVLPGIAGGVSAKVSKVDHGESESFTTVYLSLPANVWSLRYVEVWKQTRHDAK